MSLLGQRMGFQTNTIVANALKRNHVDNFMTFARSLLRPSYDSRTEVSAGAHYRRKDGKERRSTVAFIGPLQIPA